MELDPYYTYPVYNSACVLSLRGRPQDSYRIYRLLLEVLLQESGEVRSIHQAKMQKDPDLAWFRRSEPELFILLNNVVPNYDSQKIYQKLRKPQSWNIELGTTFGKQAMTEYEFLNEEPDSAESNNSDFMFKPTETVEDKELDIGYIVPPEERKNSLTVTPDDELFRFEDSDDLELSRAEQANRNKKIARESLFRELDSFLDSRNLFADPDIELQEFSKFDTEEVRDGFVPFVPQSLREQISGV